MSTGYSSGSARKPSHNYNSGTATAAAPNYTPYAPPKNGFGADYFHVPSPTWSAGSHSWETLVNMFADTSAGYMPSRDDVIAEPWVTGYAYNATSSAGLDAYFTYTYANSPTTYYAGIALNWHGVTDSANNNGAKVDTGGVNSGPLSKFLGNPLIIFESVHGSGNTIASKQSFWDAGYAVQAASYFLDSNKPLVEKHLQELHSSDSAWTGSGAEAAFQMLLNLYTAMDELETALKPIQGDLNSGATAIEAAVQAMVTAFWQFDVPITGLCWPTNAVQTLMSSLQSGKLAADLTFSGTTNLAVENQTISGRFDDPAFWQQIEKASKDVWMSNVANVLDSATPQIAANLAQAYQSITAALNTAKTQIGTLGTNGKPSGASPNAPGAGTPGNPGGSANNPSLTGANGSTNGGGSGAMPGGGSASPSLTGGGSASPSLTSGGSASPSLTGGGSGKSSTPGGGLGKLATGGGGSLNPSLTGGGSGPALVPGGGSVNPPLTGGNSGLGIGKANKKGAGTGIPPLPLLPGGGKSPGGGSGGVPGSSTGGGSGKASPVPTLGGVGFNTPGSSQTGGQGLTAGAPGVATTSTTSGSGISTNTSTSTASGIPMMGGMGGMGMGMGGMGGAGGQGQDRERATWLAEDEEVWGTTSKSVGPSVLGRSPVGVPAETEMDDNEFWTPGAAKPAARTAGGGARKAKAGARDAGSATGDGHVEGPHAERDGQHAG